MKDVFIVQSKRTPIGSFNGCLSTLSASELGGLVLKEVVKNMDTTIINEVLIGNVLSANVGQAPAQQAAVFAGIPNHVPCTTINKVCASGMKAIMNGVMSIQLGINDVVIAGGMESMSNVPMYLDKGRNGYKYGHGTVTDGLLKDGLWDPYHDFHMGNAVELCAKAFQISRADQDQYAIQSYKRTTNAYENNYFDSEIMPITIINSKGLQSIITEDEEYKNVNYEKIKVLRTAFDKNGSITAANASKLSDGAAAVLLMSGEMLQQLKVSPFCRIVSMADASQAPELFGTTPAIAIQKALDNAKLNISDIDFFEVNEAFSVVCLANQQLLQLPNSKTNIWGGAISLGHPLGCSGARIMVTLNSILQQYNKKYGLASICNGGGGASAMIIEKC